MPTADRLAGAVSAELQAATRAYLRSGNAAAFEASMSRALTKGHTAAYLRGTTDRTGVLASGLSRTERAEVRARIADQLGYLRDFATAAPTLSPAAIAARSALYAGAFRATYYGARFPGMSFYPGDGTCACLTNCKCHLESDEDGVYWVLGPNDEHCDDCRDRAAGSPYVID